MFHIKSTYQWAGLTLLTLVMAACGGRKQEVATTAYEPVSPAFSADSAMAYIEAQCAFGPRVMNSVAHDSCEAWIQRKFESFGAAVSLQKATLKLYDGTPVRATNIIASYKQDAPVRLLICAHWDSRPWADHDHDSDKHHTPIDGANDGASGVGVMLELARMLHDGGLDSIDVGIDFVCFDAEDCGTPSWVDDDEDHEHTWCLGSQHWSTQPRTSGYRYGILLDMVGGMETVFAQEYFSMRYAPRIVDKVWATAQRLGYGDRFVYEEGGAVTDDHLPVNRSGIPCIDIIGSDKSGGSFCKTWHTMADNPQHIDRNVLKAVGQTLAEVIWKEV